MRTKERRIGITAETDLSRAILETQTMAEAAGFGQSDQSAIATVASELATNILRYAGKGCLEVKAVDGVIEIIAKDKGPGITDVARAMEDYYSTTVGSLGVGLPGVKRLMDEVEIESAPGRGTTILTRKRV